MLGGKKFKLMSM